MSGFIAGLASPSIPLYEEDTPVLTGTTLTGLTADPLPPDGVLEYQLLAPQNIQNPKPLLDYLMDITVECDTDVPPGEVETSTIRITLAGKLDRPVNQNRDIVDQQYSGMPSGITTAYFGSVGILRILYNEPILIRIQRVGGNPAVTMEVAQVYRKLKRLD